MKKIVANFLPIMLALLIGSLVFIGYYTVDKVPDIDVANAERTAFISTTFDNESGPFVVDKNSWEYGYLTATTNNFKILQLTDTHFTGSKLYAKRDEKMKQAIRELVAKTTPNLIILTGDLIYSNIAYSFSKDNKSLLEKFGAFINEFNIPWTMTFGNHEVGPVSSYSQKQLAETLITFSNCLFASASVDGIIGNHYIPILNGDGSIRNVAFMFNASIKHKPISQSQVSWYENTLNHFSTLNGKTFLSMAFYHIPQQEFSDAWWNYKQKNNDVVRHFGNANEPFDNISSPRNSLALFEKIVALGSTKAIFVGHNHANDFSVSYSGIRLTFGRCLDFVAYDTLRMKKLQRGATLIEIDESSSFSISQIDC